MMTNKKEPEIRFKGFEEEWKEENFNSLIAFASEGGTPNTINEHYYKNGTIPFIKIEETKNKYIYSSKTYITDLGLNNSSAWIIPVNSIILTNGATIGNISINKIKISTKQGILGIIPSNIMDIEFFYYVLKNNTFQKALQSLATTGTFSSIKLPAIKMIDLKIPNINEQQKIGSLLSNIDTLITSQELKLQKLQTIKQSLLDKIFASHNERVPKIRFKGFEEEWKENKIKYLFEITRGEVLSQNKIQKYSNSFYIYPVYSSQTMKKGLMGYYYNYLFENCITWTTDGANAGTVMYRDEKFYCTNVCGVLKQYKLTPNRCLAESLSNIANNYVTRNGNPKLMNNTISEIEIQYPESDIEQGKISTLLNNLDSLITWQEFKIEKLNNIKKSLLDKMFC
ncbi:restriction endonuclease subunit S [Mycoplasma sp. CR]|uniref:restriction endonuclease subunit S n=1 Tax=unclassified Mycoplasma TaxID=2683645 RepID=UPI003AB05298